MKSAKQLAREDDLRRKLDARVRRVQRQHAEDNLSPEAREVEEMKECAAVRARLQYGLPLQWNLEHLTFGALEAISAVIRTLHPPGDLNPTRRDMPTADTHLLFALADHIDAALRQRKNRIPWRTRATRRGPKDRGVGRMKRHLMEQEGLSKRAAERVLRERGVSRRRLH